MRENGFASLTWRFENLLLYCLWRIKRHWVLLTKWVLRLVNNFLHKSYILLLPVQTTDYEAIIQRFDDAFLLSFQVPRFLSAAHSAHLSVSNIQACLCRGSFGYRSDIMSNCCFNSGSVLERFEHLFLLTCTIIHLYLSCYKNIKIIQVHLN